MCAIEEVFDSSSSSDDHCSNNHEQKLFCEVSGYFGSEWRRSEATETSRLRLFSFFFFFCSLSQELFFFLLLSHRMSPLSTDVSSK